MTDVSAFMTQGREIAWRSTYSRMAFAHVYFCGGFSLRQFLAFHLLCRLEDGHGGLDDYILVSAGCCRDYITAFITTAGWLTGLLEAFNWRFMEVISPVWEDWKRAGKGRYDFVWYTQEEW